MEKLLIFIKHNFTFLWNLIEWGNGILFSLLYDARLRRILPIVFNELVNQSFSFRRLVRSDANSVHNLISSQASSDLEYFRPHAFDPPSINKQFGNRSFLPMGVYQGERLIGYFFLRFFVNKKCFVGRLIDRDYRRIGIGLLMNSIMYETVWRMNFRCLSTISRNNSAVMRAHSKNPAIIVLKELQNNYLLVEFVRKTKDIESGVKG